MKTIILGVAAAAMTFASGAAMAQPYYGGDRGGYDQRYRGDSDRRDWGRNDNRRGYGHGPRGYRADNRWRQGQVYPHYRQRGYVIDDYRRYNLAPPRPGYRYYRSDNGDVVMAAIASGLIGLVIGGALSDNNNDRYDSYDRGGYYR
ncbi:MAG: RcnB family protein [Phenylobacterium sp.]|nr:RcnB family protein [Phenylobacterium sp.]